MKNYYVIEDWVNGKLYICKGLTEVKEKIDELKKAEEYDYSVRMITEMKLIEDDNNCIDF